MKLVCALLLSAAFLFDTCDKKTTDTDQISPVSVRTATVPDTVRFGEPVTFEVTCGTPNPCWTFSRFDITQSANQFTITALAAYDGRPCIQTIGSFTARGTVAPKERGTYTLQFWRAQNSPFEKTVIVQ